MLYWLELQEIQRIIILWVSEIIIDDINNIMLSEFMRDAICYYTLSVKNYERSIV